MQKQILILTAILILQLSFCIENCYSQWEPDVRLTNATGNSYTSLNNAWGIAANGNMVHTVWYDQRDGNYEIYYKRSTDNGTNWEADIRLTNNSADSRYPSIAVSGSLVHIVWQDKRNGNDEIYYILSTDSGISWGMDTRLTNNPSISEYPSIAVSGSNVHIVWDDDRNGNNNFEIYYKRSTDGGINWEADTRQTNNYAYSARPSIAVSGSVVHIVWHDNRDGIEQIYYKRSIDNGIIWGTDTRLTHNVFHSWFPSISASSLYVHIIWADDSNGRTQIYYNHSTDGGTNWGAEMRLTNDPGSTVPTSIAVSGLVVHIVWYDNRDGNEEIYYKRSTDGGLNWGIDTRLTNDPASSLASSIAVYDSHVHIVWRDSRDGNYEIYYKRNPTGNPIGIHEISTEILSAYILEQNYPNPFNATTKIKFDIPAKDQIIGVNDNVMLIVYNIYGSEVATIVNEVLPPGTYEIPFDATKLNSGIYFYKLQTKDFVATKQMILIK
jgi:hypothetical protein